MGDESTSGSRYRAIELIGEGGFGRVTRSFDRTLRRLVATKETLKPGRSEQEHLIHEARLLAYLDHPGVVAVYDVVSGERSSYSMQLLDGQSLQDRIGALKQADDEMPVFEAVRIVTRVSETMANAHDKGVLHLDLKPDNIMLARYGQVSVIDWGTARFFDTDRYTAYLRAGNEDPHRLAPEGRTGAGTPAYMSVEQLVEDGDDLGPPADVFAVGTLLYQLLTGSLPFRTDGNPTMLAFAKASARPRPPSLLRADVSEQLEALCLSMLSPKPAERPSDFHQVLAELSSLADFGQESETVWLRPGEVLFSQGDEGNTAFQILEGELEISVTDDSGRRVIATRQVGDVIGELALLSKTPRSATVTAKGTAEVRVVDWSALDVELRKANPLLAHMLHSLSDRLIEATHAVRDS